MHIKVQIKTFLYSFAVVALLLAVLGALMLFAHRRSSESSALLKHSAEVGGALNEFSTSFDEAEAVSRSLINFGHTDGNLKNSRAAVWQQFNRLADLTRDNSSQIPNFELLKFAVEQRFSDVDRLIRAYETGGSESVIGIVQTGTTLANSRQVNAARGFIQKEESRLLIERGTAAEAATRRLELLNQAVLALLIVAVGVSAVLTWRSMNRQKQAQDQLRKMYNDVIRDSRKALLDDSEFAETMAEVEIFLKEQAETNNNAR